MTPKPSLHPNCCQQASPALRVGRSAAVNDASHNHSTSSSRSVRQPPKASASITRRVVQKLFDARVDNHVPHRAIVLRRWLQDFSTDLHCILSIPAKQEMAMHASRVGSRIFMSAALAMFVAVAAGCATYQHMMGKEELSGANESPPVSTKASGLASIKVGDDGSVSGEVTVSGMVPTAAHIHHGAAGKNGPVIIPLTKVSDDKFVVPPGAKFTDAQYAEYKAGEMYVNVHSAAHKPGEIRAQLQP